jgi:predicted nucleotidyltransferase
MITLPEIQRYCNAIAAAFKPVSIILFGSYAYGVPNEDSDVDVLVVMPRIQRSRHEVATRIRMAVDCDFPVDVLVRGEAEVKRRLRQKDMFITHVTTEGRVMYEALHA